MPSKHSATTQVDVIPAFSDLRKAASSLYSQTGQEDSQPPAKKPHELAHDTARWARIMSKWLITHSSKGGVKWQVVSFNGKGGQESRGIVDMIAIRKNHKFSTQDIKAGDLFEIVLVQVKGGNAKFPSAQDVERLMQVAKHHNADKVVLTEWKKGQALRCFLLPDMKTPVPAADIFGKVPSSAKLKKASGTTEEILEEDVATEGLAA